MPLYMPAPALPPHHHHHCYCFSHLQLQTPFNLVAVLHNQLPFSCLSLASFFFLPQNSDHSAKMVSQPLPTQLRRSFSHTDSQCRAVHSTSVRSSLRSSSLCGPNLTCLFTRWRRLCRNGWQRLCCYCLRLAIRSPSIDRFQQLPQDLQLRTLRLSRSYRPSHRCPDCLGYLPLQSQHVSTKRRAQYLSTDFGKPRFLQSLRTKIRSLVRQSCPSWNQPHNGKTLHLRIR